jgi:hypothetical protein
MSDPVGEASRAAAEHLATEFGPGLVVDVEEALNTRKGSTSPDRFFDPISLGGLIVSVATLAWTVYRDLVKTTPNPTQEVVTRRVRVNLEAHERVTPTQRDRIIDVVVTEILTAGLAETD